MAKRIRRIRKTLLAVGEGKTEVAFLNHLRVIFCSDQKGVSVKILNAYGKGPENVVETLISHCRGVDYDHRLALLDTDILWTTELKKLARAQKIELIGSTPCIEGLLLQILSQPLHSTSLACKKKLQGLSGLAMTDRDHYAALFSCGVLMAARQRIPELNTLLNCFEGHK